MLLTLVLSLEYDIDVVLLKILDYDLLTSLDPWVDEFSTCARIFCY